MPKRIANIFDLKNMEQVKLTDLARLAKVKYSTLLHYKSLGLLPIVKVEGKRSEFYPVKQGLKVIKEIQKKKKKGQKLVNISKFQNMGFK